MTEQQHMKQADISMTNEERRSLTEKLLAKVQIPPPLPRGFDPLKQSDEALMEHGLPPRPDKTTRPRHRELWERVMSSPLTYIPPQFKISDELPWPPRPHKLQVEENNTLWSGAIQENLPPGQTFATVTGTWTVPNVYPPASAKNGAGGWNDGTYTCSTWVGLDETPDVLQVGVASLVNVTGGQIQWRKSVAWWEWYPALPIPFVNFPVAPGDTVTCSVSVVPSNKRLGWASVLNPVTNQYSSARVPAPLGTVLNGRTAEWIIEDPVFGQLPMLDFGFTTFIHCLAGTSAGAEADLTGATLIDMVQGSTTLATAVAGNASTLVVLGEALSK